VRAIVLALVATAATGTRAHAESAEAQVERLAAEAVNAYRGAEYNRAVELLTRAYEIRQVPALLYNLAKAYDKLGDVEHAYDSYRRYADSADADPKLKAKADARLATLETVRRKQAPPHRLAEPTPPPEVEHPPPKPAVVEPPPSQPLPPTAEQIKEQLKDDRQRDRRRDRYVTLGLGIGAVAFVATAIGLSVSALELQSRWSSLYGGNEADRRAVKDEALVHAGIADGFYAATAVTVGIGAYFLYRGFRPEPTAPSLALLPSVSATGGGLVAAGRF
jgi:tetratricopeptide (TPR) repeat protein